MKQARIEWQGQVRDVLVNERDQVRLDDGTVLKEGEFRWLPPANGTLFALGLNYADHASELEFKPPTEPWCLSKRRTPLLATSSSRYARITSNTCTTKPNWWW